MIYLLKPEVAQFEEALNPDARAELHQLPLSKIEMRRGGKNKDWEGDGRLYWRSAISQKPRWARFVESGLSKELDLNKGTSHSGVLFIQSVGRIFAITFGHGRHLLDSESYELDFGLRVTLNIVDHEQLRSIETKTFDENVFSTLKQSGKAAELSAFGFGSGQDLVAAVAGIPRDSDFGVMVAGKDALAYRGRVRIQDLPAKCKRFLEAYCGDNYKEHFAWIDSIRRIRDSTTRAHLDGLLVQRLQEGNLEEVFLSPPDIIDWNGPHHFRIRSDNQYSDAGAALTMQDYVHLLKHPSHLDLASLKRDQFVMISEDDPSDEKWPLYRCITHEIREDGRLLVLHGGEWYAVDERLNNEVDEYLRTIPTHATDLPTAGTVEHEGEYNKRVCHEFGFACLDRKLVRCAEARTAIEACDILTPMKQIIHVKDLSSSSKMSHLFVQAGASSRALQLDRQFRDQMRGRIEEDGRLDPGVIPEPLRPQDFEVVLGIMSRRRKDWPICLPFLTKFGLWECLRHLQSQQYRVCVQHIVRDDRPARVSTRINVPARKPSAKVVPQ